MGLTHRHEVPYPCYPGCCSLCPTSLPGHRLDAMEEPRAVGMMMPGLARTARMAQEEDYQPAPYYQAANDRSDSEPSSSNAYSAPAASAGPDHVDYGAYTGGYGAFGWYTDHPVLLTGH